MTVVRVVLGEHEWRERRAAHRARVDAWTAGWRERRQRGERHPVDDFLFTYYPTRPAALRRWHPGICVALEGGVEDVPELADATYVTARVDGRDVRVLDTDALVRREPTARFVDSLLTAQAHRPAQFGCFGLHEWAMVHGLSQAEVRHESWPLRVSPAQVAATVEEVGLRCTHIDAYRFFTDSALPLNEQPLSRDTQVLTEQRGCLHATMDLYKWASKLSPAVGSDLVADCFALARDVRDLDMRAAPYDLSALGHDPVPVETPEGRAAFAVQQRALSTQADPLRERLRADVRSLLDAVGEIGVRDARA